jgi:hypothetical protein
MVTDDHSCLAYIHISLDGCRTDIIGETVFLFWTVYLVFILNGV